MMEGDKIEFEFEGFMCIAVISQIINENRFEIKIIERRELE
jgi:hypothetical protein